MGEKNVGSCGGICERFVKLCGSRGLGFRLTTGSTTRTMKWTCASLVDGAVDRRRCSTVQSPNVMPTKQSVIGAP